MLTVKCQADGHQRAAYSLTTVRRPTLTGLPPGSLLIRVRAASICGTDLSGRNETTGREPIAYLAMCCKGGHTGGTGHELLGTVVEAIAPSRLHAGTMVLAMAPLYIRSMTSLHLMFEQETHYDAAVLPFHGGFAEYIVSHESCCLPLHQSPSPAFNPLYFVAAQPLGTILHACCTLPNVLGKTIAIVGQGGNGLIMTRVLANLGARQIIVLDFIPERLAAALKSFGATHTIYVVPDEPFEKYAALVRDVTPDGNLCDICVEMVGHQGKTLDLCAQLTKENGTILLFGLLTPDGVNIEAKHFVRNLQFVCSSAPTLPDFANAVEMIQRGLFDPSPLFSHTFDFKDFPTAYQTASEYRDGVIKVLLTFGR